MSKLALLYILVYASVFMHEFSHVIMAKSLSIPIEKIKIGTEWPQFSMGKWRVSPIIGNSYVEVDYESLIKLSKAKIVASLCREY